jgi:glycerol dehydrogenase-like iron-containing ADH family enzyme
VTIGRPFPMREGAAIELLAGLEPATVAVNDPPWAMLAERVPPPQRVVPAWDMEVAHLEQLVATEGDAEVVVGIGGGTALDTAKYLAWRTGKRLVQVPSILSVDAGFTNAIGVRDAGRVRYVGQVEPELVLIDLDLIASAPPSLNRAGAGDILSCHTGLFDWRLAADRGHGVAWDADLATLGRELLADLDAAAEDIGAVSADGLRFIAGAFRRIGAACAAAGHSRFEEGSEHFWAYCYEHATGAHQVHGELIALGVAALSFVQGNDPGWVLDVISRTGVRAHPAALAISAGEFEAALVNLRSYARAEGLDYSIADVVDLDAASAVRAWHHVGQLGPGPGLAA